MISQKLASLEARIAKLEQSSVSTKKASTSLDLRSIIVALKSVTKGKNWKWKIQGSDKITGFYFDEMIDGAVFVEFKDQGTKTLIVLDTGDYDQHTVLVDTDADVMVIAKTIIKAIYNYDLLGKFF
jgi:hypothetical protein